MRRKHPLLVALVIAASALTAVAGEAPAEAPDLKEALKGFKGFLVGELVKTGDEGIVLLVRAVTLVEGSQAANPGVLLGMEAPVRFPTKKDDEGNDRPDPELVKTLKWVQQMPPIAFGGLGGNAVTIMHAGQRGQQATAVTGTAHLGTMRINGAEIQLGGDPEQEEPDRKPKGPTMTARVRAGEDGKLVVDRVMPGSTPGHTWAAMPRLRFRGGDQPDDHVAAAADAERIAMKAQQQALKAQLDALAEQAAVLKKQLARDDLTDEQTARLRAEHRHVVAKLAALKDQLVHLRAIAELRKRKAMAQKRAAKAAMKHKPPKEVPRDTDF